MTKEEMKQLIISKVSLDKIYSNNRMKFINFTINDVHFYLCLKTKWREWMATSVVHEKNQESRKCPLCNQEELQEGQCMVATEATELLDFISKSVLNHPAMRIRSLFE